MGASMNKLLWAAVLMIVFTIGWEVGHFQTVVNDNAIALDCNAGAPQ